MVYTVDVREISRDFRKHAELAKTDDVIVTRNHRLICVLISFETYEKLSKAPGHSVEQSAPRTGNAEADSMIEPNPYKK